MTKKGSRDSSAEEIALQNLKDTLLRATNLLSQLEALKKGDCSPELKQKILTLSEQADKHAVELLTSIEKLEASLKH